MMKAAKLYIATWWKIIARPILFYTTMPSGEWSEEALNFAVITSWVLSFLATLVIFFTQYLPIGLSLVEGLSPLKLLIVSPVILVIASVFFVMTILITGGIMLILLLGVLGGVGVLMHFTLKAVGGRGSLFEMVKASFYSGSLFLFAVVPCFTAVLTKFHLLTFWQFRMSENIIYYLCCIYIWGLWAIAGKKVHDVPRWKAIIVSFLPALILILMQVLLDAKLLPKIAPLLS